MLTRRQLLVRTALAAPAFIPQLRAASPNGKVRHASFGAGGQAMGDLMSFKGSPHFELVAVADVDTRTFARVRETWPEVKCYQDWRELLAKEGDRLDSVNVSTPDHMHAAMGAACLEKGLALYGQKPLTQTLKEARFIRELAAKKGVVTQMGIQESSTFVERHAVMMMRERVIGDITEVHTFSEKQWGDPEPTPSTSDLVPTELDWEQWLGVAAERPFIKGYYHPGNWRKRRDFGTGTLGDMGCHIFSGWMRGLELGSPLRVKSTGPAASKDNWAINGVVEYVFPGTKPTGGREVTVTWYDGTARPPQRIADLVGGQLPGQGSIIIGTEGAILFGHQSTPRLFPQEKFRDFQYPKLEPRHHYRDFIEAVRSGGKDTIANFEYAGPLTEAVLIGCLASLFPNETLEWDGAALAFKNKPEANAFVSRSYRAGWTIPGLDA